MSKAFKYLRYVTAFILIAATLADFIADAVFQAFFQGFDGPLAWYSSYTFGINKIVFAIGLAIVLLTDFELTTKRIPRLVIRVASLMALVLSLTGFGYLIMEHIFFHETGQMSRQFLRPLLILYIFQLGYILLSIIVLRKTFPSDINPKQSETRSNA